MRGAGSAVAVAAPAKLNLYLHVTGRRTDGFHLLDSLVAFAAEHDTLIIEPSDRWRLSVEGPMAAALSDEPDNLVLRAGRALADALDLPDRAARIRLVKRLPVAAGIGGGSADAAATLRGLLRLWRVEAPANLMDLAATLGADVPVCVAGLPAWVSGIGERIEPATRLAPGLEDAPVLLVNPGVAVPTPAVFEARQGPFGVPDRFDQADGPAALARALAARRNDLAEAAIGIQPVIADCLDALRNRPGVLLARMSGSGATCFALFENADACAAAATHLRAAAPDWWVAPTTLVRDATTLTPDLTVDEG